MANENEKEKILLPHHEQQPLCTTRLPYRQGRKLTAVKVYTINNESAHLLIFNVPALNLRQELKSLFSKFGKILQLNLTNTYKTEQFTEVYHILYERIQSARFAKKMADGKGFYGEVLHICYAPEFESIKQTNQKLMQRRFDVLKRLNTIHYDKTSLITENLDNNTEKDIVLGNIDSKEVDNVIITENVTTFVKSPVKYIENSNKLFMGEENTIFIGKKKRKRRESLTSLLTDNSTDNVEIVDCTNVNKEVVTNINEHLNYNNFGNEVIKKVTEKPLNRIKFNKKD